MSAEANKNLVERFLHAMLGSERETLAECLAVDTRWYPPTFVKNQFGEVVGRAETIAFLCDNPARFYKTGSRGMVLHSLIGEGDRVSALFDFQASPQRGGRLDTIAHFHFRCRGGEIAETWEVLCTAEWSAAVLGPPTE